MQETGIGYAGVAITKNENTQHELCAPTAGRGWWSSTEAGGGVWKSSGATAVGSWQDAAQTRFVAVKQVGKPVPGTTAWRIKHVSHELTALIKEMGTISLSVIQQTTRTSSSLK